MTVRLATRWGAVCAVVVLTLAATAAGVDAGPTAEADQNSLDDPAAASEVLIVDADGSADYAAVQAAVDAAEPGDTVRVRPGTYRESVTVDKNLTLVAPRGATLDGSDQKEDSEGIVIGDTAAPVIDGFDVVGYHIGVYAKSTDGDWTLRNATVRDAQFLSIVASGATGDWHLRNVTVRDLRLGKGISASDTSGDWRLTDVTVRNVTLSQGIEASGATGDWTAVNVTVANVDTVAIDVSYSSGDWRIANSTVRDTTLGIGAIEANGDWTVWRSTFANISVSERIDFQRPAFEEGMAIHTARTNGTWTVRGNRFVDTEAGGVLAPDADPAGDAAQNWWDDGGPATDDCSGNVDCSDPLATWPPESPLAPPSTPTPTVSPSTDAADTTTANAETSVSDGNAATENDGATTTDGSRTSATETGVSKTPEVDSESGAIDPGTAVETTASNGPLSTVLTVVGVALAGLLAGRRTRSRR
ncbi:right-handed parallel beta-helix repeat-containing protein [Halosimplex sp. J119]